MDRLQSIFYLGVKEFSSLARDAVFVGLIIYAFTYAVYGPAKGAQMELRNAAVAIVDEDRSQLSARINDAFLPPFFLAPHRIEHTDIDRMMDAGRYTFVIDIPPHFQANVEAGRRPGVQVNVDATSMSQAGRGATYISTIIDAEVKNFIGAPDAASPAVKLVARARFNPNLQETWFLAVTHVVNNITMIAIILTGGAIVREREHGTIEHLLVLPLHPSDIMLAKIWSSAVVIVIASTLSLLLVVETLLGVPLAGSLPLFMAGAAAYMFSATSLGIFLATIARSMPQFGLLALPAIIVLQMLSGGTTPLDAMPPWLQRAMQFSPTTHFVDSAMAILFRGAGLADVWPQFAAVAALGLAFFSAALVRFRATVAAMQN